MDIDALIWKYLDKEITPQEINQFQELLENDKAFGQRLIELQSLDLQLRKPLIQIPNTLESKIYQAITEYHQPAHTLTYDIVSPVFKLLAVVITLATLLYCIFYLKEPISQSSNHFVEQHKEIFSTIIVLACTSIITMAFDRYYFSRLKHWRVGGGGRLI
jgi:predicted PurR-regulated permease PerM